MEWILYGATGITGPGGAALTFSDAAPGLNDRNAGCTRESAVVLACPREQTP